MTINMKLTKKLPGMIIFSTLICINILKAEDLDLPVINKPDFLNEGVQRVLTEAQITELLPWAKDSKLFLHDLTLNIQGLPISDKIEHLIDGIKQVVGESAPKNSELLMRYVLNRGLVLNEIISHEIDINNVGYSDVKLRVLMSSVNMAIKYYDIDVAELDKLEVRPFAIFASDYFEFLSDLNKSVFDASAQYKIERITMEWLQWDLYRDLNNVKYAPLIVKINNSMKFFPNTKITDRQSIILIRQMKSVLAKIKESDQFVKIDNMRPEVIKKKKEEKEKKEIERREAERKEKERQKIEDEIRRKRSYSYNHKSYYHQEGCYNMTEDGTVLWNNGIVDNSNCESQNYEYISWSYYHSVGCFQKSLNDKIMWSKGAVSNSDCSK